jgi:predicted nucleic acid-binding protein
MADAVSDTGPLIHLDEILQLDLLIGAFIHIYIPEHVLREISNATVHTFIHQNNDILSIKQVPEQSLFSAKETCSDFRLHLADLAVVAILYKKENSIALTDDMELRKTIESTGRSVVGTVGILFRAYKRGTVDENELRNPVDLLFNDSSLYLSSAFKKRVLAMIKPL